MSLLLDTLVSYVPELIRRRVVANPAPPNEPSSEILQGAVLFADISGFTAITEQLALRGDSGAEQVSQILNDYFGTLINIALDHGGDVIKFAGDALLVIWPGDSLRECTLRAASCASLAQRTLSGFRVNTEKGLSMRMGIGAGAISMAHLGGIFNRWEFVTAGDPIEQVKYAEHHAQPGQIIVSPEAWQLMANDCSGEGLAENYVLLKAVNTSVPLTAQYTSNMLPESVMPAMRAYIPGAIVKRIDAGQTDWLAELRRLTILFINLPDITHETKLETSQRIAQLLQRRLYHYEGSVNKISVDDKGVTLVAAFGLPPFAHEDDAARGVLAAMEIRDELERLGYLGAIGVTTGRVFCGVIGNQRRREYTMIGDSVNLSARLMTAARRTAVHASKIPILCDSITTESAKERVNFETLQPILVKGRIQPVPIYIPKSKRSRVITSASATEMVGRDSERFTIAETLRRFATNQSGILIIEGEAGIGKTRLLDDLERQARALSMISLKGAGEAIEQSTPYYAWRSIISDLLELEPSVEAGLPRLVEKLSAIPNAVERAPLLAPVLPFGLDDNDLTAQMTGQTRADNMHHIVIELFKSVMGVLHHVLIFEDAHWLDASSWALLRAVTQNVDPLLGVIITRPPGENAIAEYQQLKSQANTTHLQLQPLPLTEIEGLLCRRLGVTSLPEKVIEFILKKAEGHPFYSEELAYALRDSGILEIRDQECLLAARAQQLESLDFPTTIQGVITSRIDRLDPAQQLALKVASVIGRAFALRVLKDIYPIEADKVTLPACMSSLERLDLTMRDAPEPELAYIFKHIITQEVAYNLLLFAQRRSLHHAVAQWYERTFAEDLPAHYPILAYHWARAEDLPRAIAYNEKSGEQALRNGAYREAVSFFSETSALAARAGSLDIKVLRRARWHRHIAEAYLGLGELDKSHESLEAAVKLLGEPTPNHQVSMSLGLIKEIGVQFLHRRWPNSTLSQKRHQREWFQESAQAHMWLARLHYFMNETLPTIYHTFKGLNLAESSGGVSTALSWTLSTASAIIGFVPMHGLAEQYGQRARAIAEQVENPAALIWAQLTSGVYQLGVGHWDEARQAAERARQVAQRFNDLRQLGDAQVIIATQAYFLGDFNQSYRAYGELLVNANRTGNLQQRMWALGGQALNLIRQGRAREAVASHQVNTQLWDTIKDITQQINHHAMMTLGYWQAGESEQAHREAEEILPTLFRTPSSIYSIGMGYFAMADMLFAHWEAQLTNPQPGLQSLAEIKKSAANLNRVIGSYSRVFTIGVPGKWLNQGRHAWLTGKTQRARHAWEKSIAAARNLRMPYDEAKALFEFGRRATDHAEREKYLQAALELFELLQARYDIEQTRYYLEEK